MTQISACICVCSILHTAYLSMLAFDHDNSKKMSPEARIQGFQEFSSRGKECALL
jgi:hypothetical protein